MKSGKWFTAMALISAAPILYCASGIAAQPAGAKPDNADLRAVYATVQEIGEGKSVANTCSRCHGANGISTTKGTPHIAGQRPAYLYTKLKAYQTGVRRDEGMQSAIKFLSDDALFKVAAYYGSLEPAPPLPATVKAAPPRSDPVAAGKAAAAACAGCHGDGGVSKIPGMPSLVGMDPKYLVTAMKAYTNGQRKDDTMKALVAPLTDSDMNSIALYYALEQPAKAQTPAKGDQAAGKVAAAACSGCHGDTGVSTNPANPSIAGQDAQYLVTTIAAYKNGSRTEGTMKNAVAGMDDKTMKTWRRSMLRRPRAPQGCTADEHCRMGRALRPLSWYQRQQHGRAHAGIAAQRVDYLQKALRAYQKGDRKQSVMSAMTATLSDADIDALALHYARQRARSVVYVPLPKE